MQEHLIPHSHNSDIPTAGEYLAGNSVLNQNEPITLEEKHED